MDNSESAISSRPELPKNNVHHRVPKSRTDDKRGRYPIKINSFYHLCWHAIVGNMDPINACKVINMFFINTKYRIICEKRYKRIECEYYKEKIDFKTKYDYYVDREKALYYWNSMFNGKNPFQICKIINKYLLDPEWRFVCKYKNQCTIRKPAYVCNYSKNKRNHRR